MNYEKKHYLYIQNVIKDRFESAKLHPFRGKVLPLRERNKLADPWNIAFMFSVCMMMIVAFTFKLQPMCILLECIIFICSILSVYLKNRKKLIPFCISLGLMIVKAIVPITDFKVASPYIMLSVTQIVVTSTYILLCYRPQFRKVDLKQRLKKLFKSTLRKILGEYAANILNR